nr:aspyridones efflux protein apdf [Quercus suber]
MRSHPDDHENEDFQSKSGSNLPYQNDVASHSKISTICASSREDLDIEKRVSNEDHPDDVRPGKQPTAKSLELARTASNVLERVFTTKSIANAGPPPDGGVQAWAQVACGWLAILVTWGWVNSYGAFQTYYTLHLDESVSTISWIGAIQTWCTFFVGTFSGRLLDAVDAHARSHDRFGRRSLLRSRRGLVVDLLLASEVPRAGHRHDRQRRRRHNLPGHGQGTPAQARLRMDDPRARFLQPGAARHRHHVHAPSSSAAEIRTNRRLGCVQRPALRLLLRWAVLPHVAHLLHILLHRVLRRTRTTHGLLAVHDARDPRQRRRGPRARDPAVLRRPRGAVEHHGAGRAGARGADVHLARGHDACGPVRLRRLLRPAERRVPVLGPQRVRQHHPGSELARHAAGHDVQRVELCGVDRPADRGCAAECGGRTVLGRDAVGRDQHGDRDWVCGSGASRQGGVEGQGEDLRWVMVTTDFTTRHIGQWNIHGLVEVQRSRSANDKTNDMVQRDVLVGPGVTVWITRVWNLRSWNEQLARTT